MARTKADIETQLRKAIRESDMTRYRLAQLTGVAQAVLSRFVAGKRSVTLTTAAKLAEALDLELTPKKRARKGG